MTVDFTALLPKAEAAKVRHQSREKATKTKKPPQHPNPTQANTNKPPETIPTANTNIYMVDTSSGDNLVDNRLLATNNGHQRPLSAQEIDFLEAYFSGKHTIKSAMIQVGYSNRDLWRTANAIVKRYQRLAGDKANIFRDVGPDEVQVAQNIEVLTEKSRPEMVRLNANALAA